MDLFELPLRIGGMDDQISGMDDEDDWVSIDIRDAAHEIVATIYGTGMVQADARASWFCLHANARFAQLISEDQP